MISEEDVAKIARLAHLDMNAEEAKRYAKDLSSILDYVAQLKEIDVTNVEAMTHVHGQKNVFRDDVLKPSLPVEQGLANAPDPCGQFFRVPLVVDNPLEH